MSGLGGGIGLVADPTGAFVGLPSGWLRGSPFEDYLVPGLVLLTVLGIAPLIVAWGLWTGRAWSWAAAFVVGVALLGWLAVQIAVIGYQADPPLPLAYALLGALIVVLALRSSVREALRGRRR
ncbi:MAG: hypothetical protein GWM92_01080 [Gemmatimonadetes bacterium]|nr:hypothetical protein [Gemmatimonadota bacterium]NIR77058.1 hypothetical protein [Gemmatimonadota bacterium]NIT85578.1 hypothetical protein [Gemmatimonadota bacterium]NIU29410.1 hypothetical protein [Gemmatimonadota bacterium]NIU34475.1 hypothetical protein [Gemmatimonadota bacterium]